MVQKGTSLEWGPEHGKALQPVQTAMQADMPVGPFDPEDSIVLEMSVVDRDSIWILWPPL